MYKKARQWPFNMTAGLQPEQLVLNYQHNLLTLKFKIKQELHEGLSEPFMSQTVWKNGMGNIRKVSKDTYIWPVSELADVAIKYVKEQREIRVEVVFRVDAEKTGVNSRILAKVRPNMEFSFPTLKYTFSEDEADGEPLGEHTEEANNIIQLPLVGTPSSRG